MEEKVETSIITLRKTQKCLSWFYYVRKHTDSVKKFNQNSESIKAYYKYIKFNDNVLMKVFINFTMPL